MAPPLVFPALGNSRLVKSTSPSCWLKTNVKGKSCLFINLLGKLYQVLLHFRKKSLKAVVSRVMPRSSMAGQHWQIVGISQPREYRHQVKGL